MWAVQMEFMPAWKTRAERKNHEKAKFYVDGSLVALQQFLNNLLNFMLGTAGLATGLCFMNLKQTMNWTVSGVKTPTGKVAGLQPMNSESNFDAGAMNSVHRRWCRRFPIFPLSTRYSMAKARRMAVLGGRRAGC